MKEKHLKDTGISINNNSILITGLDSGEVEKTSGALSNKGFHTITALTADDAADKVNSDPGISLLLIETGNNSSIKEFSHLFSLADKVEYPVIIYTDIPEEDIAGKMVPGKLYSYINKSSSETGLIEIIRMQLAHSESLRKLIDHETALENAKSLYQDLVETAQDLVWQCDSEGRYTYLNPAWEDVLGYPVTEMLGKKFSDFQTEEYARRDMIEFKRLLKGNTVKGLETVHFGKDNREINLVFNAKFVHDNDGNIIGTRGSAYDITERKKYETAMKEQDYFLNRSQKVTGVGSYIYDIKSDQWSSSQHLDVIFGTGPDYIRTSEGWLAIVHPDDRSMMTDYLTVHVLSSKLPFDKNYRIINQESGNVMNVHGLGELELDDAGNPLKLFGTIQDITEQVANEESLKEALVQKESLFKELQHRVKNSLTLINSLISLQSENTGDSNVKDALASIEGRIESLAKLFEMLYETGDIEIISLDSYLDRILDKLVTSLKGEELNILFVKKLDKITLDAKRGTTVGIIVNELVTNSFKYAFQDSAGGEITVEMKLEKDNISLSVMDNGTGFEKDRPADKKEGLGLELVSILTQQLKGESSWDFSKGTRCTIIFPCNIGYKPV